MAESSDRTLLDLIRRSGPLSLAAMATLLGVTPTAVRNRLTRLVGSGMVERKAEHGGRGRPKYTYQASVEAHKRLGQSYAELAVVLWDEMMRTVEDRKLRRILFQRITDRLAELYRSQVNGDEWEGRLFQLGTILHNRGIEAEVTRASAGTMPMLRQHTCPYYELAEVDRAVCAMERRMFEKVLGRGLRLSQCRLDGHQSCDFEAKPTVPPRWPELRAPTGGRTRGEAVESQRFTARNEWVSRRNPRGCIDTDSMGQETDEQQGPED